MGKRKLHGSSFYQCDWTGFPMKVAHCYMPTWNDEGKLIKKGSYCNWESVVAHAAFALDKLMLTPEQHLKILEHIHGVTGCVVETAPHYDKLAHTKGRMDAEAFHVWCTGQEEPITAVKIDSFGEVYEVIIHPRDEFKDFLHTPYDNTAPIASFHTMRRKGSKNMDHDLTVWYYGNRDLQHNATASSLFKMQLYGDVLLMNQSREGSFLPRERYVSLNKGQFEEQFAKRKRVKSSDSGLTPVAYGELKKQMQADLNQFETSCSEKAVAPKKMMKVMSLAPSTGKKLAAAAQKPPVH